MHMHPISSCVVKQSSRAETWGSLTGYEFGGSLVGDLIYNTGVFSLVESLVWQSILRDVCDAAAATGADDQDLPLVVDGGANLGQCIITFFVVFNSISKAIAQTLHRYPSSPSFLHLGYFSLLALSHGCRVIAFEPQQRLWPLISRSLHFNSFNIEHLAMVPCALSDHDSEPGNCLLANEHQNWGEWSLTPAQVAFPRESISICSGCFL